MSSCYRCRQPILLRGRDLICPYCVGGFIQNFAPHAHDSFISRSEDIPEMINSINSFLRRPVEPRLGHSDDIADVIVSINSRIDDSINASFRSQPVEHRVGLMDALDAMVRQRMAGRHPNFDVRGRSATIPGPYVVLHGRVPFSDSADGAGPGLEELIEQLSTQGATPASHSSIEAIPSIQITNVHLCADSHCPVCQEKFELGTEARQMPCDHIYHSDCIVPWLVQNNTCPVCRVELPPQTRSWPAVSGGGSTNSDGRLNLRRRNPFPFLCPFRSSGSNTHEYSEVGESSSATSNDQNHGMKHSGWRFVD